MIALLSNNAESAALRASDAELLFKNMAALDKLREGAPIPAKESQRHGAKLCPSSENIATLIESQVQLRTADLSRQAQFDALTHLPNRNYFREMLDALVQAHNDSGNHFTLLFLDLDGFKTVNDTLGHHIGDELLRHVSARLVSSVRAADTVSRLGGDEFVILLADTDQETLIESICQRIIDETARPYWFDKIEVNTSCSIGIACYPKNASTASELIEHADEALYISKQSGKKTYQFYASKLTTDSTQATLNQNQFKAAIEANHFSIVVDPQFDLKQNKLSGAALTINWQDEQCNHHNLPSWLPLLQKSQWEYNMGLWLLDSGCYYLQQWQPTNPEWIVTLPVLPALWQDKPLVDVLENSLAKYQVSPSQIQLEFSLFEFQSHGKVFRQLLQILSQQGFQITLSDVGKAPLDLALLAGLSPQELKLDADWVAENLTSPLGQKWISALIAMAKSLDSCVIATDITTLSQAKQLIQLGCSLGQGALWANTKQAKKLLETLSLN